MEVIENSRLNKFHYTLLAILGTVWAFIAVNTISAGFVIALLKNDPAFQGSLAKLGSLGSAALFGMLFGAWLFGYLADRIGRKKTLTLAVATFSIGSIVSSFSGNLDQLIALRFIVGLGLGGSLPVASSYFAEFMPKSVRGAMISILESFWAIGTIIIGVVAILVGADWRSILLFGGAIILLLPLLFTLPESPRYLLIKGRVKEAEETIREIFGVKVKLERPEEGKRISVGDLWRKYGRVTLMLTIAWFSIAFAYYGFFIWLPKFLSATLGITVFKSFQYFIITAIAQLPGYWSAAYLLERIGRKKTLSYYLLLSGIAGVGFYFAANSGNEAAIIASAILFSFFNLGAWGAIYAYTPELYPTAVRGTGTGWAGAMARMGGGIAPILAGKVMEASGAAIAVLIIAAMAIAGALDVLALGEETMGKELS
ncbi:major facilitator superfamily permease 14 [Thermococcus cleftensis]|uniref:Major facilitator superfamily permease 14 n=1 Tax=Thermococcus cleftensis (strain DSM 27260 / KACC 17922 / CL1) TaxID=163003 RepID=I3ZWI8_THECF|nr:MFS transporter [Thermococcus cleftensis]AFL96072.1 major facilitator superfamily permease 14 [Thermococcus cleftensis]